MTVSGVHQYTASFAIERYRNGSTAHIAVAGELDLVTSPRLREACAREQVGDGEVIVLDLSQVSFMDSTGLHALLDVNGADRRHRLRVIVSPSVGRIIDICGLRSRLPIIDG